MLLKQTDLSITDNQRGIALLSILARIINRIRSKIDHKLRCNQNAFRPERSTTTNILILRRLIEGVRSKILKVVPIYVDFKKAVHIVAECFKYLELMRYLRIWFKQLDWSIRTPMAELLLQMETLRSFDILAGDMLWGYLCSISVCNRTRLCND